MAASTTYEIIDCSGEVSRVRFPLMNVTAGNVAATNSALSTFGATYLAPVLLGNIQAREITYQETLFAGPWQKPTNADARREYRAIIRGHDATSFAQFEIAVPTANPLLQNPSFPGYYFIRKEDGSPHDDNNETWNLIVTLLEASANAPDDGTVVIDEIVDGGSPL